MRSTIRETKEMNMEYRRIEGLKRKMDVFEQALSYDGLKLTDFDRIDRFRKVSIKKKKKMTETVTPIAKEPEQNIYLMNQATATVSSIPGANYIDPKPASRFNLRNLLKR